MPILLFILALGIIAGFMYMVYTYQAPNSNPLISTKIL